MLYNIDDKYKNYSYCGYTVDPQRRLRQHNGELKGGAKATRGKGKWKFLFLISGFSTSNNALSCEWRLKHPDNKKIKSKIYNGIDGRILTINEILNLNKWTEKCDINNSECKYNMFIIDLYKFKINVPSYIQIVDKYDDMFNDNNIKN
jgi:structure-specific endonuclease subunit SLX1